MVLVPRFLQLGAVAFELKLWTDARAVSLAASWPGGRVMAYALGTLWHQPPDDRIALLRAGATITDHVGVYAAPTNDFAERDLSDFANGCMNWLRIAGALPSLDDSYQVGTNFLDETLVIPRPVFIELVTRMVEI